MKEALLEIPPATDPEEKPVIPKETTVSNQDREKSPKRKYSSYWRILEEYQDFGIRENEEYFIFPTDEGEIYIPKWEAIPSKSRAGWLSIEDVIEAKIKEGEIKRQVKN